MNLLIKILYLFCVIISSKIIIPKYINGNMNQQMAMLSILYLSNILYRLAVNYYYKKTTSIYNIAMEGIFRTIMIIVGIVLVNYLISNPQILNKYGIEIPDTNMYTSTAISLLPFLIMKSLFAPDI